jgi:hypothetical protein
MPDISMCKFKECPIGADCFRLQAKPSSYQVWCDFRSEYKDDTRTCWYKLPMKEDNIKTSKRKLD